MKVVGLCGASGAGKTTLIEALIAGLKAAGLRVSTVKHAHHGFEIDQPGKDSWRHRQAGAHEVVVASSRLVARVRQHETPRELDVHELLAELGGGADWALVEGFRHAELPKLEVWRAGFDRPPLYPVDPAVIAVVTDAPTLLPSPTALPVLPLGQPAAVVAFLLQHAERHEYRPPERRIA